MTKSFQCHPEHAYFVRSAAITNTAANDKVVPGSWSDSDVLLQPCFDRVIEVPATKIQQASKVIWKWLHGDHHRTPNFAVHYLVVLCISCYSFGGKCSRSLQALRQGNNAQCTHTKICHSRLFSSKVPLFLCQDLDLPTKSRFKCYLNQFSHFYTAHPSQTHIYTDHTMCNIRCDVVQKIN